MKRKKKKKTVLGTKLFSFMRVLCIYCNLFLFFPSLYKHFKPFFQFPFIKFWKFFRPPTFHNICDIYLTGRKDCERKKCEIKECEWVAEKFMKWGIKECEWTNCFRKCGIKNCDPYENKNCQVLSKNWKSFHLTIQILACTNYIS